MEELYKDIARKLKRQLFWTRIAAAGFGLGLAACLVVIFA